MKLLLGYLNKVFFCDRILIHEKDGLLWKIKMIF